MKTVTKSSALYEYPSALGFAGPNGAGKSTVARKYVAGRIEIVNPDDIAFLIAPEARNDRRVVGQAGRLAVQRRGTLLDDRQSFAIETTLTGNSERLFMAEARERGYKVNLVFVGVGDVMISRSRVATRMKQGGHSVPVGDLERRFSRSMAHLADAMEIAHRTLVIDNSGKRRRLILIRENGRTKRVAKTLPQWARAAIPDRMRRTVDRGLSL